MIDSINLDKIFGILAEEIFTVMPDGVIPEGKKVKIQKATEAVIPVIIPIFKDAFLSIYKDEFSDEELGQLLAYYGPGSTIWSFFNTADFFPWLRKTIRGVIHERIEGLDLTSMSQEELQNLAQIELYEILEKLPEWVKISSTNYLESDLCHREATLGDKITEEGNRRMAEIDWIALLEKSGITPFDED